MIVGDDIAVGRDQEARAAALLLLRDRLARPGKGVEPDAERDFLLGRDVDHRGLQLLDTVGKALDTKRVVQGKSVSVSVDLGGRRSIKKQNLDLNIINAI